LANYFGQGWQALMGLAFIPLYIHYLGVEAWGLVGFMATLQAWFVLLDMGLSPALGREMARFTAGEITAEAVKNLLCSLEILVGIAALLAGVLSVVGASWLAEYWLKPEKLAVDAVTTAIALMGWVIACRMAEQLYRGALQGLQRQVWLNVAQAVMATVRWAGVIPILIWVSPTIQAFFIWQGVGSLVSVGVLAWGAHHFLPATDAKPYFSWAELHRIKRYAGGMVATALLVLFLTQIDKLLLSKLLSLQHYGYYMLAATVAGGLIFFISPLTAAMLPHLTELAARRDEAALRDSFHRACQWLAVSVVPAALVIVFFAKPLLFAWSRDAELADQSAPILSLLALGTLCNAFMNMPYMLQLAHGWSGFAARVNVVAALILVPALFYFVPRYGALAAASIWLALNLGHLVFSTHFIFRRLLPDEKWNWYRSDVVMPLLAGFVPVLVVLWLWPKSDSFIAMIARLAAALFFSYVSICFFTPATRKAIQHKLRQAGIVGSHKTK
jgi:O-antigen/teichoic acid export membrane protein